MAERPTSVRRRLLLGLFGAIVCVVVFTHLILLNTAESLVEDDAIIALERDAWLVREALESPPERSHVVMLAERADAPITVTDAKGRVVADSHVEDVADAESLAGEPEMEAVASGEAKSDIRYMSDVDAELIMVAVPRKNGGVVRLAAWHERVEQGTAPLETILYWLACGTVIAAILFSVFVSRWVGSLLSGFVETTRKVARGEAARSKLAAAARSQELVELSESIKLVLDQRTEDRQRIARDSTHLNALLDALELPVLMVNPAGHVVRTNMAARSRLDLLYTLRNLDDAGLSALREPMQDALEQGGAVNTRLQRGEDEWVAHIEPMTTDAAPVGALVVLTPIESRTRALYKRARRSTANS